MMARVRSFRLWKARMIGPKIGQWSEAEYWRLGFRLECRRLLPSGDYEYRPPFDDELIEHQSSTAW